MTNINFSLKVTKIDSADAVAFSPNGRWLATVSQDHMARLIETATGREAARIAHDDQVLGVTFSPDGRWLATVSQDHTARLIEIVTGTEVHMHGG